MRRTHLCTLLFRHSLRRLRNLAPPFHPARPLPTPISPPNAFSCFANRRFYSGEPKAASDVDEIELALESKETVYFNEEAETAREAVKEVLDMFQGLLGRVGEDERGALQRSMGMKIEQLKAELEQLNE
ncbi:unnamed protein product [Rhodiola kirilowii]